MQIGDIDFDVSTCTSVAWLHTHCALRKASMPNVQKTWSLGVFLIRPMAIVQLCEVVNDRKHSPKMKIGCVEDHNIIGTVGLWFHGTWGTQIPLLDHEVVGSDMHP